jgi:two-component system sensor histidine kinase ChiS
MARISIVDNDKANVSSITDALKLKGHSFSLFNTSSELMGSLQKKQPDMIIISVSLDGEDGRELSKLLHTETPYKNIPVILTSPFYHTDHEIRSFCCDDLVSMPLESGRLATSVEVLLAKEQARLNRQVHVS